ncbi:hypothetical protein [Thalassobacillus pellis]|uniref:hypothetical protein n=1 Tax=Thalassobacillus pellis TaxID=748008 RepID=UPI001960F43C|nr:hypothetical protein [Thalassobacillus pellis]MBM7552150.1 hypothetical protein [Thalassobacillus pellis]
MRKMCAGIVFVVTIAGILAAFFPVISLINKLFMQLLLPFLVIYLINKKKYWFNYHLQTAMRWTHYPLLISILFLGIGAGYDILLPNHMWVLPALNVLMFGISLRFWSMFMRVDWKTRVLSFERKSVFLLFNMLAIGIYGLSAAEFFLEHKVATYTFIGSLEGTMAFLLGYTLIIWGRKEHVVDRRTVEGMVRKLE